MNEFLASRTPRERIALGLAAFAVVAAAIFLFATEPGNTRLQRSRAQLRSAAETEAIITGIAAEAIALKQTPARAGGSLPDGATLMSLVDETALRAGILAHVKRLVPAADREVSVVFESVPFGDLMTWLAHLHEDFGVSVDQFNANPGSAAGRTNVSVVLML